MEENNYKTEKTALRRKKNPLWNLSYLLLVVAAVSGYLWYTEERQYSVGADVYNEVAHQYTTFHENRPPEAAPEAFPTAVSLAAVSGSGNPDNSGVTSGRSEVVNPYQAELDWIRSRYSVNFEELQKINPQTVGWIFNEDLSINYPVMQGEDNDYYLTHLVNNKVNKKGSIFVDVHNYYDFTDDTTVIFGHNMRDGSMFSALEKYKDQAYYDAHPFLYYLTPEHVYRLDVLSGYITKPGDVKSLHYNFYTGAERDRFIEDFMSRSMFKSRAEIDSEDHFVSLYTCDYDLYKARFVVQTRLVQLTP